LRKLRKVVVQFLVDLARPSQLNVNPFLRGFYFSGVRPTVIEDDLSLKSCERNTHRELCGGPEERGAAICCGAAHVAPNTTGGVAVDAGSGGLDFLLMPTSSITVGRTPEK